MNCENCGGRIRKGDSYCPSCGMELLVSEYKPLQKKYMRGQYQDEDELLLDDDGFYPREKEDYNHGNYHDQRSYQNREDSGDRYGQKGHRDGFEANRRNHETTPRNRETSPRNRYETTQQNRHQSADYDHEHDYEYEQPESSSGWLLIVLFLVIALMVGFVIGLIMYSSSLIFH